MRWSIEHGERCRVDLFREWMVNVWILHLDPGLLFEFLGRISRTVVGHLLIPLLYLDYGWELEMEMGIGDGGVMDSEF